MNYDLIVATTATNRPDLHNDVFPSVCEFLSELSCLWLINIDCISYGDAKTEDETKDNFLRIFENWSNITPIFSSYSKGKTSIVTEKHNKLIPRYSDKNIAGTYEGFYRTSQYLFEESCNYESKYGLFWFEDDWLCVEPHKNLKGIFDKTGFGDMQYLGLAHNSVPSGAPGVYGNFLVSNWVVPALRDETNDRWMRIAERVLTSIPSPVRKTYHFNIFRDVGREWTRNKISESDQREEPRRKGRPIRTFNVKGL